VSTERRCRGRDHDVLVRAAFSVLTLVTVTSLAGCVASQNYVGAVSRTAAESAVKGAAEEIPELADPLRKIVRQALLEDDTLPQVAQRITQATVESVQATLRSPEMQKAIDDIITRAMTMLVQEGSEGTDRLIQAAAPALQETIRRAIVDAAADLRGRLERDVTPTSRALAATNAELLVNMVAAGLDAQLEHIRETAHTIGRELISTANDSMNVSAGPFGEATHAVLQEVIGGVKQAVREGLPDHEEVALIAAIVVVSTLLVLCTAALALYWWRYQRSAKWLAIVATSVHQHRAAALKSDAQ
jgi:hypothetical protein